MARILAAFAMWVVILACGCVSPLVVPGGGGGGGTTTGGKLYVSTPSSILRYGNALTANGNIAPEVTVTAQLSSPQRIFIDTTTDRLFVANRGGASVLIFSPASTMTGSATPSAVLTSTGNISAPVDVAVDTSNNLLYVADGQNILVFTGESSLSGSVNTAPARAVNFTFTIGAIFLNASSNTLFVDDPTDNAVVIVSNASTASGSGALFSPIAGSATLLGTPNGMEQDNAGRPIVSNVTAPASIAFYPAATVPSGGNVAPAAVITGSATKLAAPGQMAFNGSAGSSGELYVADSQAPGILTYLNVGAANSTINLIPNRTIIGSGTGLNTNAVNGMALDTTR